MRFGPENTILVGFFLVGLVVGGFFFFFNSPSTKFITLVCFFPGNQEKLPGAGFGTALAV